MEKLYVYTALDLLKISIH